MESIVISSKIRLARNICELPFPNKLSDFESAKSVAKAIYEIFGDEFVYTSLKNMSNNKLMLLLENNTISYALAQNKDIASFASNIDKNIVIMINEDDHIREVCNIKGYNIDLCFDRLNKIDNKIINKLDISYSQKWGFLTASPKNVGTAMKVSVKLFLPALTFNNAIEQITQSLMQNGLILKVDESKGKNGYFYELNNKYTLGISERDIICNVKKGVEILVDLEQKARQTLLNVNKTVIMDMSLRAYGILTNSYILSCEECIEKLSKLRFGVVMGLVKLKNPSVVDDLLCQVQLGHLQDYYGLELNAIEEKVFRAKFAFENLENKLIRGVR